MRDYIFKRLLLLIPTLFGITLITFFIIQLAPGNPVERKLQLDQGIQAEAITQQIVEETRKLYGLDKPIYVRYWIWVKQIATLDFGRSYKDHRPVINKIAEKGSNFIGFKNKQADKLIEEARTEFDRDKRQELYRKFAEIIHEEQPYTFLFCRKSTVAVNKRFENVVVYPLGIDLLEWHVPLPLQMYSN